MGKPIIDDELWALIEPLLPPAKPRRFQVSGPQAGSGWGCADSHPVRAEDRYPLARFTGGDGMRLWCQLLAQAARLAASRRMGSIARSAAGQVASGGQDRLFARVRRLVVDPRGWGGRKTGPNPTDRARPGSKHPLAPTPMERQSQRF